jgi:uncharacterized membrane protein YqhA
MTEPAQSVEQEGQQPGPTQFSARLRRRLDQGLGASCTLMAIPVVVLVLSALGAFAYGTDVFVNAARDVSRHPLPVGDKVGYFLVIIDLFLIGATMMIAAIGLYELFVAKGEERTAGSALPKWLEMRDLNDLKARVVAMAVLVSATTFVEVLVDGAATGYEVLEVGAGIALVIAALTAFLRFGRDNRNSQDSSN